MITTLARSGLVISCLALAACFPRTEPEAEGPEPQIESPPAPMETVIPVREPAPEADLKRAEIDWTAARQDFATREVGDNAVGVANADSSAFAVPVLLPTSPIRPASADGTPSFRVVPTRDGYYAVFEGEAYDMVINGTDRLTASASGGSGIDPETLRFDETLTGAQVSFRRYGASYLVEFNCKGRPPAGDSNCISEEEAINRVEDLLIAGTR